MLTTPIRRINGSETHLNGPQGIALDSSNNIYVANYFGNSVTVYPPGKERNVPPINTIHGSKTKLDWPIGLALR